MIKVSRQNLTESYIVTADWLSDYIKDLQVTSNLNNIKHLVVGNNTIEQKMSDIKKRVGFEDIRILAEKENKKIAQQNQAVESEPEKKKFSETNLKRMDNILQYIQQMVKRENNLSVPVVLERCQAEDGLYFHNLRIDLDKLKKFIQEELDQKSDQETHQTINYIPVEAPSTDEMSIDSDSDYYSHAYPSVA